MSQDEKPPTGFPEPPASFEPGNISDQDSPYTSLNNPVRDPDPTESPDPYDTREDPLAPPEDPLREDIPHTPTGATSTSAPHPAADIEADRTNPPQRDDIDD
ncbi:MAG: hypothetical protein JWM31_3143 [Solirubrobacterales bacterium]|nr:hypothetical protein [Solirubrobacterales bacterium]